MARTSQGVRNARLRWALFGVLAVIIAACSTSIEDSPAVQAAASADAAQIETTTTQPDPATDSTGADTADTAATTEPIVTEVDSGDEEVLEEPVDVAPLSLVDTPIVAALSESGRAPAFGGGNPRTSVADALQVSLPSVGGPEVDVSQYLGQDVVLWFWAPWCVWCNAEAPRVDALSTEFAGQVEIVGVAGVSDEASMQDFVDRHDLSHITHLADLDGHFWFNLDVTYQPWWMFINDDGEVVLNWQGRLSEEEIRAVMDQLVNT